MTDPHEIVPEADPALEAELGRWFERLEMPGGSLDDRRRLERFLRAYDRAARDEVAGRESPVGGLRTYWGVGALVAAAAVLVVALVVTPLQPTGPEGSVAGPGAPAQLLATPEEGARLELPGRLYVVQDPDLPMLHGLETFEGADVRPGDLIAGLDTVTGGR